jgi:hypothetical protein
MNAVDFPEMLVNLYQTTRRHIPHDSNLYSRRCEKDKSYKRVVSKRNRHFLLIRVDSVHPITVAARSKAWTVFARSNTGIVGSNPSQGMDVCV